MKKHFITGLHLRLCRAINAQSPSLNGKTLINAVNRAPMHTPTILPESADAAARGAKNILPIT